jgi:ribosomal protein S9
MRVFSVNSPTAQQYSEVKVMTRYLLTKAEQKELRAACNYMGLSFHAQAARPAIARQLIRQYQDEIKSEQNGDGDK